MNEENIYIVSGLDIEKSDVFILNTFVDKLKAINYIIRHIEKTKREGDEAINDVEEWKIYNRKIGWIYSTKTLKWIYNIHKTNKYPSDFNGVNTVEKDEY